MNNKFYSNKEFTDLKNRLNSEMIRRGGFRWLNPLSTPKVGENKTPPLSMPVTDEVRIPVDDRTYTINNTSEGSIEPTRNIHYPANGENPAGSDPEYVSPKPNTSAAHFTVQEMKNFIVGLSKIDDINLFYGRDEQPGLAYRDPKGIEELTAKAELDKLHEKIPFMYAFRIEGDQLVMDYDGELPDIFIENEYLYFQYTDEEGNPILARLRFEIIDGKLNILNAEEICFTKNDPNGGQENDRNPNYPVQDYQIFIQATNGIFVFPSGEYDGEELKTFDGLGPNNFFDDYGAEPGDGDYHPYNRAITPVTHRDIVEHDDRRRVKRVQVVQGGRRAADFGPNPRNPELGNEYQGYPIFRGVPSTCNNVCTGLCSISCDDICSESCTMTCTMRCGNACTSSCGNQCSGCSSQCYNTCKTKCENNEGFACVKAGAKTMDVEIENGMPVIHATTYSCNGCSYSCQFYPNKKTTCWDAGCMGKCFTACNSACSESCTGSCIGNESEGDGYKTGKGQGCSAACTVNCVGSCHGVCEGQCTTTCWHACKQQCTDNCEYECSTNCGSGCADTCTDGCKNGCFETCHSGCKGETDAISCINCGSNCAALCQNDCDSTCFNRGCNAICGVNSNNACAANCRMNCSGTSCTAECSDACSSQCTTCVNSCGFECGGSCTRQCDWNCESACRYKCDQQCENTCSANCVKSCTEECGSCSSLCFSCVGMCIGVCAVKCENGCSACTNNCGYWCDTACNQECFSNCSTFCMATCSDNCETHTESETTHTTGPERKPTSYGYEYPDPQNRKEERSSFQLLFRGDDMLVDPFHFFIEGSDLKITMDDGVVLNLHITEDGYLVLVQENDSYEEHVLAKYRFTILSNGYLKISKTPVRIVDPAHFEFDGDNLWINPREGLTIHMTIDEDGYLQLESDSDDFYEWVVSKYKFTILEDGSLELDMVVY